MQLEKFGVIICPRCRWAKGVRLDTKSSKCTSCGYSIELKGEKTLLKTNHQKELSEAVGQVNAQLKQGLEVYLDDLASLEHKKENKPEHGSKHDILDYIVSSANKVKNQEQRILCMLKMMKDNSEEFEEEDLKYLLAELGVKNIEKTIETLISKNLIYQPKAGIFRCL